MAKLLFEQGLIGISSVTEAHEREALLCLFHRVAHEKGWRPGEDVGRETAHSWFIAAELNGGLVGGIEVRQRDEAGTLPIYCTWPELIPAVTLPTAELVLLALTPNARGNRTLLWMLCVEMWRECLALGLKQLLVAVPLPNYRVYRRLGWDLEIVGPERFHWGEPCLPCLMDLSATGVAVLALAGRDASLHFVADQALRT
jgi:hypothetical protein